MEAKEEKDMEIIDLEEAKGIVAKAEVSEEDLIQDQEVQNIPIKKKDLTEKVEVHSQEEEIVEEILVQDSADDKTDTIIHVQAQDSTDVRINKL